MSEELTPEQVSAHEALCLKIDDLCRGPDVSYDSALLALVAVAAQLCTEVANKAETCLTVCEDLLAEFRDKMENRPDESIIAIPDPN